MKNFNRSSLSAYGSALLAAAVLLISVSAQAATPGAAQVKKVVGKADYTDAKGGGPLKEGDILMQGATIITGAGSYVDLDMGINGNALRVEADSTLSLNKLEYTRAGETVVNTELEVKKGSSVANVINKLSKASKYEIKTPAGVAGIRGTVLRATTSRVVCLIGKVEFRTVNGALQLVIGGQVYAAGAPASVKATSVETTSVAVAATGTTANTQSANAVNQAVKQFTTVVAAEAAVDAGAAGAGKAAADASKAVLAALIAAVTEAANNAPPAIRAQAQAAARDLANRSEAIQATAAADGAALGVIAGGGTKAQAQAAAGDAAGQSTTNPDIKTNAQKNADNVAKAADDIKQAGGKSQEIIGGPVYGGPAGKPVDSKGSPTSPPAPPSNPSNPATTQVKETTVTGTTGTPK